MRRAAMAASIVMAILVSTAATAGASLPGETPRLAYGVNGKVRAILQVGSNVWVAGQFTQVVANSSSGAVEDADQEVNLVAFNATTGAPVDVGPDLGGVSAAIVYDLALDPNGTTVYAAGKFKGGGATNLVAFNGTSGSVTATYSTPALFSAHRDATGLYAGGGGSTTGTGKLYEVVSATSEDVVVSVATRALGGHTRKPQVVDIATAPQGGLFIACKCDSIESQPAKAFAHINANGTYDTTWDPGNLLDNPDSAAFGWRIAVRGSATYLAAGGSDFVLAVESATGRRIWLTDTNGSAQTVTYWADPAGDRVIVGGHWRLIDDNGWYCQPRLAALLPGNGSVDRTWHPAPNPNYNGVWAVQQSLDGSALWAGGEFTKVAEDWVRSGDGCAYVNGDTNKPQSGSPNEWARGVAKLGP